jgi:Outer membrane protein beta-barrel domain
MQRAWMGSFRILACVGLFLGAAGEAQAQSLGAKGGISLSSIKFDGLFAETTGTEIGLLGGGFAGLGLPAGLRLQVEGLIVEERAVVEEIQEDRFRYLEVPVLLRYRVFGSEDRRAVRVNGGVVVRRLLSAEETIFGETFSIKDGVRANDMALALGGDIDLTPRLNVDVRYQTSREGTYRRANGSYAGKQRAVRVLVGYTFKR